MECNEDVLGQALPAEHQARTLLAQLRTEGVGHPVGAYHKCSMLGLFAVALREYFCSGPTGSVAGGVLQ